jgi:hypothetical protein
MSLKKNVPNSNGSTGLMKRRKEMPDSRYRTCSPGASPFFGAQELDRAIRLIGEKGLGRMSPAGPVGLIVGVELSELQRLREGGVLRFAMQQSDFDEDELVGGPCLVCYDETFGDLVDECGPENAFEGFLKNAYLGAYDKRKDEAILISAESLWQLVPRKAPPLHGIPDMRECRMWDTEHQQLAGVRDFCGTHAVCQYTDGELVCGEKMCHAEHSWVRGGVCLCYMSSGGVVTQFYLYPFKTTT